MAAYTDRLSALYKSSVIRHSGLTRGRDEILAIHRASQTESIAGFIIVTGDTGSGKSTLVTEVRVAIMRAAEPDKVPCVYFEIPEQTSRKTLVGALLEAMDDDDPYGPKEAVLLSRLTRTVPEKGVELIIADEMQHLVSDNRKVNKKGADLLMRADTGLHADQARRSVRETNLELAERPLLSQHDGAALIQANNVERGLADVDADHRNRRVGPLCHGVLLSLEAPRSA
jgi:energy-coupling factor transporter ATP-binding protein EcfA2